MAIKQYTVVRFISGGREYEVDERLIDMDRTMPSRTAPGIHHIWFKDGETHFRATNVTHVNLIWQAKEKHK
ncbi:hypothetical protein [Escherichia coli]|uniref:hypothetical protein n=1 Tax=Escherichia coli TaxID=562 RepID=UPI001D0CD589|nr:hypothetical protein [Escherichia coli]